MLLMTSPLLMKMYYIENEQLGNGLLGQHLMLCENELPLTPFFVAVRQFYCKSTEKMLKTFYLGTFFFMTCMLLILPVSNCKVNILVSLAKWFSQLN